ncbi:MAG TPA: hypothetical protein PKJ41_00680 [Bryobacteraceae bacterium]|nr:hypothetical protein [Bryobacteraceae bacterium]HPT26515.1 hypothetical protein [Bryobacteraceae bacterium]
MTAHQKAAGADPESLRAEVESFLASCRRPAAIEPGLEPLPVEPECLRLSDSRGGVLLEVWNHDRTLARRLIGVKARQGGRLELIAERLGGKTSPFRLVDLDDGRAVPSLVKAGREVLLDQLDKWLARQFTGWRVETLTTGADLEHSLSPAYPRALVAKGTRRWAVVASPPDAAHGDKALTHGLIWLDYLRLRGNAGPIEGLALFMGRGTATNTLLRLRALNPRAARWRVFEYDAEGRETEVDVADSGNLIGELAVWAASARDGESTAARWARQLECLEGVEAVECGGGERSLRVRGVEFARLHGDGLMVGIDIKRRARGVAEGSRLAAELAEKRIHGAVTHHRYQSRQPERWLESVVRANPRLLCAGLELEPIYGQVTATAGTDRGLVDLLAIDTSGRLTAIELKAAEDPHLPLQALDYWARLSWHAARGGFSANGYFPGRTVLNDPPRLFLVAPAFRFHSTVDRILAYFSPEVEVARIGLGVEWQRNPRVVLSSGILR